MAVAPGAHQATHGQAAVAQASPNVLVIETDDQTARIDAGDGERQLADRRTRGRRSRTASSTTRSAARRGPPSSPASTCTTTACSATRRRTAASAASRPCTRDNNLAVWLQDAGYYTAMIGKYLNGYSNSLTVPPGWSEWYAAIARPTSEVYDYTLNENGTPVHYGYQPRRLQAGRADPKGGRLRQPPGAQGAAVLPLAHLHGAPLAAARTRTRTRRSTATRTAKPAPRHAHAFDSEPLPRPPNFNEADVSDKPGRDPEPLALERGSDRGHPAQVPLRAGIAAVGGRGRQSRSSMR